jgi:hypothetical protein
MPSRWSCLVIVAFWLSVSGWLLWRDVWPNWEPGQPPPFTIDMEEEASQHIEITWDVSRNNDPAFIARTWVDYHEKPDDSFSLQLRLKPRDVAKERATFTGLVHLDHVDSEYRVSRRGELLGIVLDAVFKPRIGVLDTIGFTLTGQVRDGRFHPSLEYRGSAFSGNLKLSDVPVSHHGSVMLPLHPVQRIEGLRRGQGWRMPMLNVLEASLTGAEPVVYLDARVLPDTQKLLLDGKEYDCLVVEYRSADHRARTWVEERTGLVLRQEQLVAGEDWAMQRVSGPR